MNEPQPGPSPRVRGAVDDRRPRDQAGGTIPAGAGSRGPCPRRARSPRDHPRGCGEQKTGREVVSTATGPSPRVRGAGEAEGDAAHADGTIPAGAGSSSASSPLWPSPGDHPRGCGEQSRPPVQVAWFAGPSPRVRGAGRRASARAAARGTIPAGAGSRRRPNGCGGGCGDHPRGCGEQSASA